MEVSFETEIVNLDYQLYEGHHIGLNFGGGNHVEPLVLVVKIVWSGSVHTFYPVTLVFKIQLPS